MLYVNVSISSNNVNKLNMTEQFISTSQSVLSNSVARDSISLTQAINVVLRILASASSEEMATFKDQCAK
jgi:hypothetical protein